MSVFWILAASLVLLALALLLPALLKNGRSSGAGTQVGAVDPAVAGDAGRANLVILREQLSQLEAELAAGGITPAQHAQAKAEIERRALEENAGAERAAPGPTEHRAGQAAGSRPAGAALGGAALARPPPAAPRATRTAVVVGLGIPLLALGLYGFLGNPQGYMGPTDATGTPGGEVTQAQVEAMVAQLAQRLENAPPDQPADPKGWEMLARTYAAMQRFPEADKAYARATALAPHNGQLLADHAEVLAMLQGQSAIGAPEKLIERALKLDSKNLKALALAGSLAFERKDFTTATNFWTQARQLAPAGSEFANGLERSIEAAQAAGGGTPGNKANGAANATANAADNATSRATGAANSAAKQQVAASAADTSSATATAPAAASNITGVVSLSPALATKVAPDDTVFIFARAAEGPRMPLAILRRKASELPINFTLDDSTAMSPEMKLSKFAQVVVGARISRSGNAMPQPGDLVGQAGPLKPPATKLAVMIDGVQP